MELSQNVTVIMGPPNSGKSYLLRTLHLLNWFLDKYTRKLLLEETLGRAKKDVLKGLKMRVKNKEINIVIPKFSEIVKKHLVYTVRSAYATRLPENVIERVLERGDVEREVERFEIKSGFDGTYTYVTSEGEWEIKKKEIPYSITFDIRGGTLIAVIKTDIDITREIAEGLVREAINDVMDELMDLIEFEDKCFMLPYDKDLLMVFWEAARSLKGIMSELSETFARLSIEYSLPPMYYSFWERMKESYAAERGVSDDPNAPKVLERLKEIKELIEKVAEGKFISEDEWIAYVREGIKVRLARSSGLAISTASLAYTLATLDDGALVLVEEPEVALHPEAQVKLSLLLMTLSKRYGYRVVVVTHSPYVYRTYALLQSGNEEEVKGLLRNFELELDAKDVLGELKLYYAHDGKLEEVSWERAPGLLEVDLKLLSPVGEDEE